MKKVFIILATVCAVASAYGDDFEDAHNSWQEQYGLSGNIWDAYAKSVWKSDPDKAIMYAAWAVKADPDYYKAYHNLAAAYANKYNHIKHTVDDNEQCVNVVNLTVRSIKNHAIAYEKSEERLKRLLWILENNGQDIDEINRALNTDDWQTYTLRSRSDPKSLSPTWRLFDVVPLRKGDR